MELTSRKACAGAGGRYEGRDIFQNFFVVGVSLAESSFFHNP